MWKHVCGVLRERLFRQCVNVVSGPSLLPQALPAQHVSFICLHCPLPLSPQGPLNITVQELDGFYTHTVQVEELSSTYELPCHSKIRKCVKWAKCVCVYLCVCACVHVWSLRVVYSHVKDLCCWFLLFGCRSKKRKVPLSCGEEVEMDLSQIEYVILWHRAL